MAKKIKSQRREIVWNVVNSLLAGALVMLGACSSGNFSGEALLLAFFAAAIVAVSQFKDYWKKEESEYTTPKRIGAFF